MNNPVSEISAIPSKRIYLSIIADYHLNLALCELIDNAIDNWLYNDKHGSLTIELDLDYDQQTIKVKDNSGGIQEKNISLIVSPGLSRNENTKEIIGSFGVGSKRAVVALSKQIRIFTRYRSERTLLVNIDNHWIEEEDNWTLQIFETDNISPNSTEIILTELREKIEEQNHKNLIDHLEVTFANFLRNDKLEIIVNEKNVKPKFFDQWSYPPNFEPTKKEGPIVFKDHGRIDVSITGGLTKSHKDDETGNDEYGVYFYCNRRLISRAYKGREVGFNNPPRLGKPHPNFSLARVIVEMNGPVELMPWNSSKSGIDFKHKAFKEISEHLKRMIYSYAAMSRNWSGEWPQKVFKYNQGIIKAQQLSDISSSVRLHLPKVKRKERKPEYIDFIKKKNKDLSLQKPWAVGLYEAIIAVEELSKLKLEQNNRISLLILDSTLEIAFKEFLLNETNSRYSEQKISGFNRVDLENEVKSNSRIKANAWQIIANFYYKRCDLVHKRATTQISDQELENYRKVVEYILNKLFKIKFN